MRSLGAFVGLMIGFAFGVVWLTLGFGPAVLCLFLAAVGWFIGALFQGRISLANLWHDLQGQRRTSA